MKIRRVRLLYLCTLLVVVGLHNCWHSVHSQSLKNGTRRRMTQQKTNMSRQSQTTNSSVSVSAMSTDLKGNDCARFIFNLAFQVSSDAYLQVPQMIAKYGYPVERHRITSKDGYKVTIFRIPHGKKDTKTSDNFPVTEAGSSRPAVILYHGLMGSSADWLILPEDQTFPYVLANAGYDVWLPSARGSRYSKDHTRLRSNQLKYWKFGWHEMGKFDVPKIIDYILAKTGEPKLYYVGHSMGATIFFVTMSMFPEYNAKIRSFYGLAPASYVGHIASPLILLAPIAPVVEFIWNVIGWGEFLPPLLIPLINLLGPLVCAPSPLAITFCGVWYALIAGLDPCQFNTTQMVSKYTGHVPDTTSFRTLYHFLQLNKSKKFRAFDFGMEENSRVYGRQTPPDYDLSKVTAKVAAFSGQNDLIVVPKDVAQLVSELPNVIANYRVPFSLWNHLDFITGSDAKILVYDEVMKLMAKHY